MDVIKVQDFKKAYGKKVVHRGVTFTVRKGECLGLIGGSGCGKSVILRSLIGLEKADHGNVLIDSEDITRYTEEQLIPVRIKVAYAFQGGALFDSMSVYENLAYPLREHTKLKERQIAERIHKTLDEFGLGGNELLFPSNLSGGMQKRLGLARAIIMDPQIVLYDEPTAGLDPYNTKKIQDMILRLKTRGITSILVTHDMPTAFAVTDRMVMLLGGKVAAELTNDHYQEPPTGPMQRFIEGEEV